MTDALCSYDWLTTALHYADIEFQVRFKGSGRLPAFRGATLRGALGFILKKVVCHVKGGSCITCPVRTGCVYSTLFEGTAPPERPLLDKFDNVPQPFVFLLAKEENESVESGQLWSFGIRLFGAAINHVPYLAYSIIQIGEEGLGRDRIPYDVTSIQQKYADGRERNLYQAENNTILQAEPDGAVPVLDQTEGDCWRIEYQTPVKYRFKGKLYAKADFTPFMMAALRRIKIMTSFYGTDISEHIDNRELLAAADQVKIQKDQTQLDRFRRYSNRQKASMTMGGICGAAIYEGNWSLFSPVFRLASLTHVGKNTSFGFGKVAFEKLT